MILKMDILYTRQNKIFSMKNARLKVLMRQDDSILWAKNKYEQMEFIQLLSGTLLLDINTQHKIKHWHKIIYRI